jgi:hypothetical protein
MSDISENEQIEEIKEVPLTKPKRERTQKQIEAFERVKEKRRQNIEAKKKEKLLNSAKLLVESQSDEVDPPEEIPQVRKKVVRKRGAYEPPTCPPDRKRNCIEPIPEESESESEEEIIVKTVRKPKVQPKKKKIRKVIIEESETSESESEDDYTKRKPVARVVRPKQKSGIFFV